jgi:hypothetical protein
MMKYLSQKVQLFPSRGHFVSQLTLQPKPAAAEYKLSEKAKPCTIEHQFIGLKAYRSNTSFLNKSYIIGSKQPRFPNYLKNPKKNK